MHALVATLLAFAFLVACDAHHKRPEPPKDVTVTTE